MLFAIGKKEPVLMILLVEKDIQIIREGRTVFVDDRATNGMRFTGVTIGHAPTNEDAIRMVESVHPGTTGALVVHEPRGDEVRCDACSGIMRPEQLMDGRCIACWRMSARKLRLELLSHGLSLPDDA